MKRYTLSILRSALLASLLPAAIAGLCPSDWWTVPLVGLCSGTVYIAGRLDGLRDAAVLVDELTAHSATTQGEG